MAVKYAISFLLIVCVSASMAQRLKRIVVRYPNSNYVEEVYYIFKESPTVKTGTYLAFYQGQLSSKEFNPNDSVANTRNGLKEKGQYKENMKEGYWISFKPPEKLKGKIIEYGEIAEKGNYARGKKSGIWLTYVENGQVIKRFDFDSMKELLPEVRLVKSYPSEARRKGTEGTVIIERTDRNCEVNYKILSDIGDGCGASVVNGLKKKSLLEKKYGIQSFGCNKSDTIRITFILDK